jgi:hypothetical protein
MIIWKVADLEYKTDGKEVTTVHWEAIKEADGHHARVYSSIMLSPKDKNDPTFIEFDNLTEELVIDWTKKQLGDEVKDIEKRLDVQIQELINPKKKFGTPW